MLHPELPYNLEAEQLTLGSVLSNREAIIPIAAWLTPEHFYRERHALIYRAMLALLGQRETPTPQAVLFELRRMGQGDLVDVAGLIALMDGAISTLVLDYAREVERCAVLRGLIAAGGEIAGLGHNQPDADRALADAAAKLATVRRHGGRASLVPVAVLADVEYARLQSVAEGATVGKGVRTGLRDLDEITAGLQDQDFIILAGRPSMGKSALLCSLAYGLGSIGENDRDVLIYSLEMSRDQLMQRLIAKHACIDTMRVRTLRMNEAESQAYVEALGAIAALPIAIDDTPAVNLHYIRTTAYRHLAETGRKAVVCIDYVQLLTGNSREGRVQEMSEISRGLKALAKELDCPVLGLAQLSRAVESRPSHVPLLSDLRETGAWEQDADVIMFLYREEVYDRETDKRGIAELHIAKHRNGPIGVVPLRFDAPTATFADLTYRTVDGY